MKPTHNNFGNEALLHRPVIFQTDVRKSAIILFLYRQQLSVGQSPLVKHQMVELSDQRILEKGATIQSNVLTY